MGRIARMCKRCEFPVQITPVIALLYLAHLALAGPRLRRKRALAFPPSKNQGLSISKERASASETQLKEVTQTCLLQGNSQSA